MSRHPTVNWAQRSDVVFITIDLPDAQDVKLKLEPEGKFFFSATSGVDKIPYEVDIDLRDKVDVAESKASVGKRNICYLVKKAENKWWSRLLKQEGKPPVFLKVDWDKWVDEDEEDQDSKRKSYFLDALYFFFHCHIFMVKGFLFSLTYWGFLLPVAPDMDYGDFDFSKLNMGGGEGFGAAECEDDDDSDTEEENVEEVPPSKEDASSAGAQPEVKKD
ncbi:CS domain - like 8 [Theobroma cacao]|nr:CS domain - like 8 [Theobroma cacao]